jgi:hypothetical protein
MNLVMNQIKNLAAVMTVAIFGIVAATSADGDPDANQEVRDVAAIKLLKERKDISLAYIKGLVCPSCALGIRIKVGKLPFVDTTRYKRGVDMDAKTQLLTVALLPGIKADDQSLSQAIIAAGYDPVERYTMQEGKLKAHLFDKVKSSK